MTDMGILTSKDLWNPNTYYYAKDRYKHMIEHEGSLYVCTSSHISGSTFDGSKFATLSGGGGGSGSLAGVWDMTNTMIPVVFDDFMGGTLTGTGPYTITPDETTSFTVYSTITAGAINSPVIFENIINTSTFDPLGIFFGYVNVEATLEDIINGFNSLPAPSMTFGCFGSIQANNVISYINGITAQYGDVTDGLAHPNGQSISFKIMQNGINYELYAKVTADSTYRFLTSDVISHAPMGVKPVLVGLYLGGFANPIIVSDFGSSIEDPIPPANPVGKRYLVNGSGIYQNQSATVGNVVEFIDINDIFITEDIEDINDGISSVVASLQQDIEAIPVTRGVLTNTTITANTGSIYTHVEVSDITTEMVTIEYASIPTPYVDLFKLTIHRNPLENSSLFVRVKFPAGSVDYNPDDYVFAIESTTNGGSNSPQYMFDPMGIESILFKITNGMIEYIGHVNTLYGEYSASLPNGGHVITIDADTSSTTYNIGTYSDIKHVVLNNITAGLLDSITVNTAPTIISSAHLPQVNTNGIKISILPGTGTFTNVNINGKILFPITPAPAGTYYYYIFYPNHDILIADAVNP